ncbi:MAG: endolytic transglycosylase MltG [Campylobacterota bacterium]|nr:endolytic transglycosylase MltG [Campylobacterota bacterium]
MEVKTLRVINIPQGSTAAIITHLDKNNYDINHIDKITVSLLGYPQSGWIDLRSTQMKKIEFLYKLTTSKAAMKKVVLIPGETYYFFLQDAAKKLNISTIDLFEAYAKYAYKKDGNILADTYHLPMGMNEDQLVKYLFSETKQRYKNLSKKIFGLYNQKNWYRYIIIASIIQKESASKKEMPYISSVIHNRINKGMKLQMDGTLNYSKYSHTKVTPKMIKEDETTYNTYKYKGIPNDPVCAVELEAIKAAIFPAKTNYYYFVKAPDGKKHLFSETYKKHRTNIKRLRDAIKKRTKSSLRTKKAKPAKSVIKPKVLKVNKNVKNLKDLWK